MKRTNCFQQDINEPYIESNKCIYEYKIYLNTQDIWYCSIYKKLSMIYNINSNALVLIKYKLSDKKYFIVPSVYNHTNFNCKYYKSILQ